MSKKIITSEVLVAYSQCQRKAFLLLFTEEKGNPHDYIYILEQQKRNNQLQYISLLKQKNLQVGSYATREQNIPHDVLVKAILKNQYLEASCDLLRKVESCSSSGKPAYEPIIIAGTYSITKEQKLKLLFVGYVLEQIQDDFPTTGEIVSLGGQVHKLKLKNAYKTLKPFIEPLTEWIAVPPSEVPPVLLNKHCPYCQFQASCKAQAEKDNDLSLLAQMTAKVIQKYHKKGIFTVRQLSYLFKPRKRRKSTKNSHLQHKPELQALAIRTEKIYLQELPKLARYQTEIFLDIEGIPDQNFYYLIGLLICEETKTEFHSFWADSIFNEEQLWIQFIKKVNEYPDAPIYHYGSYEPKAISQLIKRYSGDCEDIKKRLVNVNKYIYGKIYFPVMSNSLKEIGSFIGASWTTPNASGLQSLVWRHRWSESQNPEYKQKLMTYNQEDCLALKSLIGEISRIKKLAESDSIIDFVNQPKRHSTEPGKQAHEQFEVILKLAHANYDKNKIKLRSREREKSPDDNQIAERKRNPTYRKIVPQPREVIEVPRMATCPKHLEPLEESKRIAGKTIIDLVFTEDGVTKTVIRYFGMKGYCSKCNRYYSPPDINKFSNSQVYGHGFQIWVAYQRVALRLPHRTIVQAIEEQFNETMTSHTVRAFVSYVAHYYVEAEKILAQHLLASSFIHADETEVNIQGTNWYVWVFTNGRHVIFKLTQTREATIVHELLSDYKGILISDFYPGYDSVACKQQKCWAHLIGDLNDDLWKHPFDAEFETFILKLRNLILPIFETIEKYGLKKKMLEKFKNNVRQFYENSITDIVYKSELVVKYQKRFLRYRESLFTFLEYDRVPWHNNTAENAIRHFAKQREVSGALFESSTRDYLLLLGIRQTCRFQDKPFLKFLLSGEQDIDKFKAPKRRRNSIPVGKARNKS